jgi:hypothetical protein
MNLNWLHNHLVAKGYMIKLSNHGCSHKCHLLASGC